MSVILKFVTLAVTPWYFYVIASIFKNAVSLFPFITITHSKIVQEKVFPKADQKYAYKIDVYTRKSE
jgi:hypothetical protein